MASGFNKTANDARVINDFVPMYLIIVYNFQFMSLDLIWRAIGNNVMLGIIDTRLVGLSAAQEAFRAIGRNPGLKIRLGLLV